MKNTSELMTVPDVAEKLSVTPQYVRKLISENKLNAARIGTQWVISQKDLATFITDYNFLIEPNDHERLDDSIPQIVALSFFSGAMGLDIGMAQGGIKALLTCEFNKYCRLTINENAPNMALIGDINAYSPDEILKMAKIPKGTKVDVIFGGPPCQAFSTAGARRALNDERGNVFLRYIEVVRAIRPTYVVIENVRGLLSAPYPYGDIKEPLKGGALCVIMDRLAEAGYTVSFELYNAANFGAPQIRERVVMIGKLGSEKVGYLEPTHDENGAHGLLPWRTLADALNTLPPDVVHHHIDFPEKRLKAFHLSLIVDYLNKTNQYYLRYQIPNVSRHLDLFIQHSTSDNHTLKLIGKFFHNFKERLTSQIQYDEQVWFPYCLSTITEEGNRQCLEIAEGKNRKEDDNTEALLADLKSIMIKHLSGDYNENLCYAVLFAITTLEKDIKQHNRIRERILGPMVQKMEKTNQITE